MNGCQTKKLFYDDVYKTEFSSKVLSCEKNGDEYFLVLEETCFYPEGGGQPSDIGFLGDAAVSHVQEKCGIIIHKTDKPIEVGKVVNGRIDFKRRFSFMQQHTGEHIVSGIINSTYGLQNVGFHMGTDFVTIDLNGELTEQELEFVENEANRAVYANVPIKTGFPDKDMLASLSYRCKKELSGDVRIVSVDGFDSCACCGLHCSSSGEVGIIKFINYQKYKAGIRIFMLCGERALWDYASKNSSVYKISTLLSAKPNEVYQAIEQLMSVNTKLGAQILQYKNEIFKLKADNTKTGSKCAYQFENDLNPDDLRKFCMLLCEKSEIAAVFSRIDNESFKFAAGSKSVDMLDFCKKMNAGLGCKAGGQKTLIQGTVYSTKEKIIEFLEQQ